MDSLLLSNLCSACARFAKATNKSGWEPDEGRPHLAAAIASSCFRNQICWKRRLCFARLAKLFFPEIKAAINAWPSCIYFKTPFTHVRVV